MTSKRIGDILASEEDLIPSSGFVASVMDRVQEEACAPPPISFPWKRAIPGIALVAGVFGWGAVELVRLGLSSGGLTLPHPVAVPAFPIHAILDRPFHGAGWVALSLALSWLSWALSRRMAGRSGLL